MGGATGGTAEPSTGGDLATGGGGTSGLGGAPALATCSGSADCEDDEICVYDNTGQGSCILGSALSCAGQDTCVKDMGFVSVSGNIEGDVCEQAGNCKVDAGHIVGICVDTAGDGSYRRCVALCQYADDPAYFGCATHPLLGLRQDCGRSNARAFLAAALGVHCIGDALDDFSCSRVATPAEVSASLDWTLRCHEAATSCTSQMSCFTNGVGPDPEATQTTSGFFDGVRGLGTEYVYVDGGGSGIGSDCSTDCDCGRCNYCEDGVCRYGGEGPYGCYRGCS